MAQAGVMAKKMQTTEDLTQELIDIEALAALAIDVHCRIEALEQSIKSQVAALTTELYGKYKGAAPSIARTQLEQDQEYQTVVGLLAEFKRVRLTQWSEITFRMGHLLVNIADHAVKNAPWFAASARSILDAIN